MMHATCDILVPDVTTQTKVFCLTIPKQYYSAKFLILILPQLLTDYTLANPETTQYCLKCTCREACRMIYAKSSLNSSFLWSLNHLNKCGVGFFFWRKIWNNHYK